MRTRFTSLKPLQGSQALAADPSAHASLSASAGTGKTHVLTARVLRLLLRGVRPESILCLTFTKAAAAEMANRVGARLATWVRLKDAQLGAELLALGEDPGPAAREEARRLFARVLEAPGGLRIQTIHSYAQALLASFPAEAGITPGFRPLEGRAEQELARSTLARLLADAEDGGDEALIGDVQCISLRLGERGAVDYLMACARRPDEMAAFGGGSDLDRIIRSVMNLPEESVDEFLAEHCADDRFDCELLHAMAEANRTWNTSTGSGHVETIEWWLAMTPANRAANLETLALVVLKKDGDRRKVSAGQLKASADYQDHADRLAKAVGELVRMQRGAKLAAVMASGIRAGQAFATAYTRAKRSGGFADFDDLIRWTRSLLAEPGMGDWVRYKLDREIDHILVDEAQDTNPAQWEIVEDLVTEYFSGSSEAAGRHRTLFMVGDFKQAIYGFQGTDPSEFNRVRSKFRELSEGLRSGEDKADLKRRALEFRDLSIEASFRSAPAVLETVDAVIREVGFAEMGLPGMPPAHEAHHAARPGVVELWKPFALDDEGEEGEEGWIGERERRYADTIAAQIEEWLEQAPVLASTQRPLSPGDILILVRSRGEVASLIVARLFARNVPVAGIDRLHLSKPFAVRDLLAAVAFAVQPLDDLNLANLLVSPLIGWSQEQLYDLGHGRNGPLWRELRRRAGEGGPFATADTQLRELLRLADFTTPAQFLETILSGPLDGRRKLYGRLGMAARDPIDELLASALEFERGDIPSLDRFLAWFSRGDVEIQRDPSASGNAVRVMTVHGAKGLEAPFVILADATGDPARLGRTPITLDLPIAGVGKAPLLRPNKAELAAPFEALIAVQDAADLQEHWRLLYVALTRAAERLVVAGVEPRGNMSDNSWHKRVERALASVGAAVEENERWGVRTRYQGSVQPTAVRPRKATQPLGPPAIPHWARASAPPETRPPRPLAPSAMAEDSEPAPAPSPGMRAAARRGTLIHQLLERLPDLPSADRHRAALRWLERSGGVADASEREGIADTVCSIIADDRFGALFGPGSIAEAPLAATLLDGRVIAGTVDRLLVQDDLVSVIDFKTGRVPASEAAIPAAHRAQMQAYAAALAVIFPGRAIRALLLYTAGPALFEISG
jgi:ATP-dependent helicase/nuclease subunit A